MMSATQDQREREREREFENAVAACAGNMRIVHVEGIVPGRDQDGGENQANARVHMERVLDALCVVHTCKRSKSDWSASGCIVKTVFEVEASSVNEFCLIVDNLEEFTAQIR